METTDLTTKNWTTVQKIAFRFSFLFFGLLIIPFPLNWIPFIRTYLFWGDWYSEMWNGLVVFTGKHILHLSYDITHLPGGSGDGTWNYVQAFIIVVVSVLGCLIWSIADRKRKNHDKLYYWLTVAVRYYLAIMLISYGLAKFFKTQFPDLTLIELLETIGETTPMYLAWSFFSYSPWYNYFMGFAEVLGGLLLLFRRTTAFGALLCMVVTANIMAINYCFGVWVKIFSTTLFLMAFYLAIPNIKRLIHFFFLGKSTSLINVKQPVVKKWQRMTALSLKIAVAGYLIISMTIDEYNRGKEYADKSLRMDMYGYYNVDTFIANDSLHAPLLTDTVRWNKVVIEGYWGDYGYGALRVKMMNDSIKDYEFTLDTLRQSMVITLLHDSIPADTLYYKYTDNNKQFIELTSHKPDSLFMRIRKIYANEDEFPLMKSKFFWIHDNRYYKNLTD